MAASPKKKSINFRDPLSANNYRFLITFVLCLAAFLISRSKSNSKSNGSDAFISPDNQIVLNTNMGHRSKELLDFWDNKGGGEFYPQIVWLMSFPNSGTSYTMTMVEGITNLSTASNYGDEVTPPNRYSLSIHPRHPEGPFWEGLSGEMGRVRPLPSKYVLVKTHCGSRCVKCPPSQYVQSLQEYTDACRNSTGRVAPNREKQNFLYPVERVKKVIHLIRNPFHNFVARFHLERKNFEGKKNEEWLEAHPRDPKGFQQWCSDLDHEYTDEEFKMFEYDMLKQVQLSPCHGEVFKYIQWHNMAFALTEKYSIESKVIWYEDFEERFEETVQSILDFMEAPQIEPPREFISRHDYSGYYSSLDRRRMRLLINKIATEETMKHIKRYLEEKESPLALGP